MLPDAGEGVGTQMNKFEQVSNDYHHMPLSGGRSLTLMSWGGVRSMDLMSREAGEGLLRVGS